MKFNLKIFKTVRLSSAVCLALSLGVAAAAVITLSGFKAGKVQSGSRSSASEKSESENDDTRELPILMYHGITADESAQGDYVITQDALEEDIRFLTAEGYTPVFCSEAAVFVNGRGTLPEKPVVLTFDDGAYSNFYYALPILEKYKVKGVFAVVGKWSLTAAEEAEPNPVYSSMDSENLRTLDLSGLCEIANHSWEMHNLGENGTRRGVLPLNGEDARSYRRALWGDLTDCARLIRSAGQEPTTFAYPYGLYSEDSEKLVRELGYTVTLTCEERVNSIAIGDYESAFLLGRFNRSANRSAEEIFKNFEK